MGGDPTEGGIAEISGPVLREERRSEDTSREHDLRKTQALARITKFPDS